MIRSLAPGPAPFARPALPQAPSSASEEPAPQKPASQHLGNVGFGTSTLHAVADGVKQLTVKTAHSRAARYLPGLNLGVAALEVYNASQKASQGRPVEALAHAGNAAGCLGGAMDQAGGYLALGKSRVGLGAALGAIGGGIGLAVGAAELHQGLEARQNGGSGRLVAMGALDLASGATSLLGAGLAVAGVAGPLGPALMVGAGLIDLSGIAVDYLGDRLFPAKAPPVPTSKA